MKCLLCQYREANQTGSHIFTHSLVSKCTNEEGKKGRNKEMMFSFSQSGEKSVFFGNEILPAKIEEVKGKELSESEIENNLNGLIADNIYCSTCEKLFGKIESIFSSTILLKIRSEKKFDFEYPDNILIRLYFYIQIWRASSINHEKWSFPDKKIEESLRKIVYEGCLNYDKGLSSEIEEEIVSFPLVLNFLETPNDRNSSNLIFIANETYPFMFFLCDFVVELFPTNDVKSDLSKVSNYCNLNESLSQKHINYFEEIFLIRNLSNSEREEVVNTFSHTDFVVGEIDRIKQLFYSAYLTENKILPSDEIYGNFMVEVFFREDTAGALMERLSDERLSNLITKHIKKIITD